MTSSAGRAFAARWLPHAVAAIVLALLLVWDREIYAAISGFRSPFLTWLTDRVGQLRGATFPSALGLLLIAIGLTAKKSRIWRAGAAVCLTVILAGTIASVMKEIVARPGPSPTHVVRPGESWIEERFGRFPSSHSAVTFGAASALGAFMPGAAVPVFIVAVLVSHERIYRATHFPSDIFAGIWIGLVAARFVIAQLARRRSWRNDLVPMRARSRSPDDAVPTLPTALKPPTSIP